MTEAIPITIIGGGVTGCAIACELSRTLDDQIVVLERNKTIPGDNQSSRNSGVIHAGIYYPQDKGHLKATLCVQGNRILYEFCKEHHIPHKQTGKLIVAVNSNEEAYLDDVLKTAIDNHVPGVQRIDAAKVNDYEPNVNATAAVHVPTSGIVDAGELVRMLKSLAVNVGVVFSTGTRVENIVAKRRGFDIVINAGNTRETFETNTLINAAGLYADELARMVNPGSPYVMYPLRGEAAKFSCAKRADLFMRGLNVYPVPWAVLPNGDRLDVPFEEFQRLFLEGKVTKSVGAHLTSTFDIADGNPVIGKTVTIGPVYIGNVGKEDYHQTRNKQHYLAAVKPFFPNLELEDITLHQAGIRARLKDHYDFVIERDACHPDCINLIGIDSPGLTASLAIAKYVRELLHG